MTRSPLKQRLTDAMKEAMRARDKARLSSIRMALAELGRVEVDERRELTDADVLGILEKMVKQRRDSKRQYEEAGRRELADKEDLEISVIEEFLPIPLTEGEIDKLVDEAITETGASGMKDMGAVMSALRPHVAGRADMGAVGKLVKQKLA